MARIKAFAQINEQDQALFVAQHEVAWALEKVRQINPYMARRDVLEYFRLVRHPVQQIQIGAHGGAAVKFQ